MHKYLSCAISRLPVLEANTVARVSGHLPGLHPQHLWCWCSWSTVLGRVSEVIDRDVRPRFFSKTGGRRFEPCYSCQPNLLTLNHILGCRPGAVLRHRRIGLCQYPLHDIAGRRAGRRYDRCLRYELLGIRRGRRPGIWLHAELERQARIHALWLRFGEFGDRFAGFVATGIAQSAHRYRQGRHQLPLGWSDRREILIFFSHLRRYKSQNRGWRA